MTKKIEVVEGNPPAPTLRSDIIRVMNRPGFVGTWETAKKMVVEGNPPAPTLHPDIVRVMNRPGFVGTWKTAMKILAEEDKAWAERENNALIEIARRK